MLFCYSATIMSDSIHIYLFILGIAPIFHECTITLFHPFSSLDLNPLRLGTSLAVSPLGLLTFFLIIAVDAHVCTGFELSVTITGWYFCVVDLHSRVSDHLQSEGLFIHSVSLLHRRRIVDTAYSNRIYEVVCLYSDNFLMLQNEAMS